ncbi:hypothetical protein JTB14_027737 [Gonioctena quinquepunctata]|nr:hypothetical protein JTB14_027737 [Gonioctena quinquepunctata]
MESAEDIVISGIAGKFPECENVDELKEALLQGIDLTTEDDRRYPLGILGTPKRSGIISEIDKFDAEFFGIHGKQVDCMDPRHRVLLEAAYGCIIDAGYNPSELKSTKTGVYVGIETLFANGEVEEENVNNYYLLGNLPGLAANRISFCFDLRGPSYVSESTCSTSLSILNNAINDIKSGVVDSAIVGATQLNLHPLTTVLMNELHVLSPDGKGRVFSSERNGYVRSESVVTLFVQKRSDCRRIYANIIGAGSNCDGSKKEGITFPSSKSQVELMREVYSKANVDPNEVTYVETHGTGTHIGDIQECESLFQMFGSKRSGSLLIGSVKSNVGHAEIASGLVSVTKVLLAMETGILPADLNCHPLDMKLAGFADQKLKVVTENLPWKNGIAGINSYGVGGSNSHLALKRNDKEKTAKKLSGNRLVLASGCTEEAVLHFLDGIENSVFDEECLALVDEIHKINVDGHKFRGFTILGEQRTRELERHVMEPRPIWFIYPGVGSQWLGMGRDLMKIEVFRTTIRRCAEALSPYGIFLEEIITTKDTKVLDDILNIGVAITAVEVALTDVLFSLGIHPDGIAGHSLGEIGCAYAGGHITPEQAALLAYARAYWSRIINTPPGLMASINMSMEEMKELLPDNIFIACRNGSTNVTISGLENPVRLFLETLSAREAVPFVFDFCKKVLNDPKPRSRKWISSSVPLNSTEETLEFTCAEYFVNNFVNPVLFDQVVDKIPENALVIEIGPHGLLQGILKREIKSGAKILSVSNKFNEDNEAVFLESIGRIFLAGGQPNLRNLYRDVSFPVSRGTKMLAPLVKWDHSQSWSYPIWKSKDDTGKIVSINISDEKYSHFNGYIVDGKVLMPASGYVEMAWKVAAKLAMKNIEESPIVVENLKILRSTVLPHNEEVQFLVNIMKHSGNFEIHEGGSMVATGNIRLVQDISRELMDLDRKSTLGIPNGVPSMNRDDVYSELNLRGLSLRESYQGITGCSIDGSSGEIEWKGQFSCYLDAMFHLSMISEMKRELILPTGLRRLVIDPVAHLGFANEGKDIKVMNHKYCNLMRSGGIEISGLKFSGFESQQKIQADPILQTYEFIHYESPQNKYDSNIALLIAFKIIIQNSTGVTKQLRICEVLGEHEQFPLKEKIENILHEESTVEFEYSTCSLDMMNGKYDVIVISGDVSPLMDMKKIEVNLNSEGFIIFIGRISDATENHLQVIFENASENSNLHLLRPKIAIPDNYEILNVKTADFCWLDKLKLFAGSEVKKNIYLYCEEQVNGLIGLVKCLMVQPTSVSYKSILIEGNAKKFSLDNTFYRKQLEKNLTFNIFRGDKWGTYVHLPILKDPKMKLVTNAFVKIGTVGDLSTLKWFERPSPALTPQSQSEPVNIFYTALNPKDMTATGSRTRDIGWEYSGVTASDRRVMGMMEGGALSLQVSNGNGYEWEVPEKWSLSDAVTIPTVYAMNYYAMIVKGQMRKGESILINSGTMELTVAAVSIALSMEATIFITVDTSNERKLLNDMFPGLENENIDISGQGYFETTIMMKTEGRGVDLVLIATAGDFLQASMRCVSENGRFLGLSESDYYNSSIDSGMVLRPCTFHAASFDDLFDQGKTELKLEIYRLISQGLATGVVKPLPTKIFGEMDIENALRLLSSKKCSEKILIQLREETSDILRFPSKSILASPRVIFNPNKSYIIIGGLGGIGLELTNWMIERGATKIILNSRRGLSTGYQAYCMKRWSKMRNGTVQVNMNDSSDPRKAENLILDAMKLGPVGGVFHLAGVLRDAVISKLTEEDFEIVFESKIVSVQHLDCVTRKHCPDLEYFVVFSSIMSGIGNFSQSNYGMACSAMESLCEKRRREKLPGLAIQWGLIGDVGVFMRSERNDEVRISNHL